MYPSDSTSQQPNEIKTISSPDNNISDTILNGNSYGQQTNTFNPSPSDWQGG